jgi:hypothetical protein
VANYAVNAVNSSSEEWAPVVWYQHWIYCETSREWYPSPHISCKFDGWKLPFYKCLSFSTSNQGRS